MANIKFKTYGEIGDLSIRSYTTNKDGKPIVINPKKEGKHQSGHPLDKCPTFFYNLDQIVLHPHRIVPDNSKNPKAIENRKKGKIVIYARDNFLSDCNIPGYKNWQGDETRVVTLYEDTGKNYTLTFYIKKK